MRSNTAAVLGARTHEGAIVRHVTPLEELRRTVLGCLLFEDMFYEDGLSVADRIAAAAAQVDPNQVLELAREARFDHGLRHTPLWLLVAALDHRDRALVRSVLPLAIAAVCDRADLPGELLAQYWRRGRRPLAKALKIGLASALRRFDAYQLGKYAQRGAIRIRDVLFLTHAKPADEAQAALWKHLAEDTLPAPDTWEVALSGGADKREAFTRLLQERNLGALAILRNLRNMAQAGVDKALVAGELQRLAPRSRILPFQFIAAARAVPAWEDIIEPAMLAACEALPKLPGKTVLLVDTSGSMQDRLSAKSELNRLDAAAALAILAREVCGQVEVVRYDTRPYVVPPRRGFALRDAIGRPSGGTDTGLAARSALQAHGDAARMLIFTDEQSMSALPGLPPAMRGYVMNVAAYKHGLAWGRWTTISGFSDAVLRFVAEAEKAEACPNR